MGAGGADARCTSMSLMVLEMEIALPKPVSMSTRSGAEQTRVILLTSCSHRHVRSIIDVNLKKVTKKAVLFGQSYQLSSKKNNSI